MPTADFFVRFGLFVERDFLAPAFCKDIIAEAQTAPWERAPVYDSIRKELNWTPDTRQVLRVRAPKAVRASIKERFSSIKPALARHFELDLSDFEEPDVLRYEQGDYFHGHTDSSPDSNGDSLYGKRRVSVVLFLNDELTKPEAGCYCGGSLVLAGLINDPRASTLGFPLAGEAGVMIAFRSDTFHEVKPVTHGERYSVVTFFY
jgi:SM-20-related protein